MSSFAIKNIFINNDNSMFHTTVYWWNGKPLRPDKGEQVAIYCEMFRKRINIELKKNGKYQITWHKYIVSENLDEILNFIQERESNNEQFHSIF